MLEAQAQKDDEGVHHSLEFQKEENLTGTVTCCHVVIFISDTSLLCFILTLTWQARDKVNKQKQKLQQDTHEQPAKQAR